MITATYDKTDLTTALRQQQSTASFILRIKSPDTLERDFGLAVNIPAVRQLLADAEQAGLIPQNRLHLWRADTTPRPQRVVDALNFAVRRLPAP